MPPIFTPKTEENSYAGSSEGFVAANLNNEALQLELAGNFVGAEARYLEALQMKYESRFLRFLPNMLPGISHAPREVLANFSII